MFHIPVSCSTLEPLLYYKLTVPWAQQTKRTIIVQGWRILHPRLVESRFFFLPLREVSVLLLEDGRVEIEAPGWLFADRRFAGEKHAGQWILHLPLPPAVPRQSSYIEADLNMLDASDLIRHHELEEELTIARYLESQGIDLPSNAILAETEEITHA